MCGRGATSACAASGRTNVVTRIAATCPPLLPHRVGGARLRQCSLLSATKCSSPKPISADARRQRARRRGGVRGDSGDGWARGIGGLGDARARRAARAVSLMSRRLRATAAGDGWQVLRKNGSANKLLRRRVLGVPRGGGRRLARRAVRARVRGGCRRGRRRVVGGARVPRAPRRRRRFAGAERGSRASQGALNRRGEWVRPP